MSETLIQNRRRAKQLINFADLKIGNMYPTDIDGCLEYKNKALALFEMKHGDTELTDGQKLALVRMIDDAEPQGKKRFFLFVNTTLTTATKMSTPPKPLLEHSTTMASGTTEETQRSKKN